VGDGIEEWEVLDLLSHLADKSLVEMDAESRTRTGRTRYRFLETVRQYARERLIQASESGALRARHRDFYLALAEEAKPHLKSVEQLVWFDRLAAEKDNLRAALQTCASTESTPELWLRLIDALEYYWRVRGFWTEGHTHCMEYLRRSGGDIDMPMRVGALACAGSMAMLLGDLAEARKLLEECLNLARSLAAHGRVAEALFRLGWVAFGEGDLQSARELTEKALGLRRDLGDKHGTLLCRANLAALAAQSRDWEEAVPSHVESLAMAREIGDRAPMSVLLANLGYCYRQQCDYVRAKPAFEEGLSLARELRMPEQEARLLTHLAYLAQEQGRLDDCRDLSEKALAISRELGSRQLVLCAISYLAVVAANQGDASGAETLYAQALAICREMGAQAEIAEILSNVAVEAQRRHDVNRAKACIEEAIGVLGEFAGQPGREPTLLNLGYALARLGEHARARRLLDDTLAPHRDLSDALVAAALESHAVLAMGVDETEHAARLFGAAKTLRKRIGAPLLPVYQKDYERDRAVLRAKLGDQAFARAEVEGRGLSAKQAIAFALRKTDAEQTQKV
jgi:tetratricopeptide (TPR) repeat protein